MNKLKNTLLNLNIVEDNEFLDKYVQLIESNFTTTRITRATQKHHIIPQCYYVNNNLPINDTNDNKVNLFYRDHILAHYYLTLCGKGDFSHSNAKAFRYMIHNKDIPETEKEAIKLAEHYQEVYSCKNYKGSMLGKHLSEDARAKISEARKGKPTTRGKISIIKDNQQKYIDPDNIQHWEEKGWVRGSITRTPSFKWMTNDVEQKQVLISEIEQYLQQGWKFGCLPMTSEQKKSISKSKRLRNNTGKKCIHLKDQQKFVDEIELDFYIQSGWMLGPTQQFVENMKNKPHKAGWKQPPVSDAVKQKRSADAKNRAWINKDGIVKRVKKDELETYLQSGWNHGRTS